MVRFIGRFVDDICEGEVHIVPGTDDYFLLEYKQPAVFARVSPQRAECVTRVQFVFDEDITVTRLGYMIDGKIPLWAGLREIFVPAGKTAALSVPKQLYVEEFY